VLLRDTVGVRVSDGVRVSMFYFFGRRGARVMGVLRCKVL